MASARNMVIAGDYQGCRVFCMTGKLAYISGTMKKMDDIFLTPEFVTRYELMTEDIIRSGNSLLLTGVLDPGNLLKLRNHVTPAIQKKGIYTVALKFEDDKRSLLEIDEKTFRAIERRMQTAE